MGLYLCYKNYKRDNIFGRKNYIHIRTLKINTMGDILWIIVVLLVIGWLFGFLVFPAIGGIIHLLLVIAVIMIVYRLLTGRRP